MKHVTTMGKKHIMLTFDMLDWDGDGEIGFEEFYMIVCILLSSEVRHSLTKHDHIKNSPSTLTTTIQGSQYLSKKPIPLFDAAGKTHLLPNFLCLYHCYCFMRGCDQCHMCCNVYVYVARCGRDLHLSPFPPCL